jgi:DNA-binding response OmpR family regulator
MKVLLVDDDAVSRRLAEHALAGEALEIVAASDGSQAWTLLQTMGRVPDLAVIDCEMPVLDGLTLCRRSWDATAWIYTLLLTGRTSATDLAAGFDAGADDYVRKPFDPLELRARVRAGRRIVALQTALRRQVSLLEAARRSRDSSALLPMCGACKRVRVLDRWQALESFLSDCAGLRLTHAYCPVCAVRLMSEAGLGK